MEFDKKFVPVSCQNQLCPFYNGCAMLQTEVVKARVDDSIDIMLVGQGAGEKEHLTHHPFTGPAGRVLREKLLPRLRSNKLNIILDNTIRSRPLDEKGKNRAPTKNEVELCIPFLWKRIEEYKPAVVVPLGASAAGDVVPSLSGKPISAIRGKKYTFRGVTFIPTFHPAAILHARNPEVVLNYHEKIEQDLDLAISETESQMRLI